VFESEFLCVLFGHHIGRSAAEECRVLYGSTAKRVQLRAAGETSAATACYLPRLHPNSWTNMLMSRLSSIVFRVDDCLVTHSSHACCAAIVARIAAGLSLEEQQRNL
jgi:hypothetical protein